MTEPRTTLSLKRPVLFLKPKQPEPIAVPIPVTPVFVGTVVIETIDRSSRIPDVNPLYFSRKKPQYIVHIPKKETPPPRKNQLSTQKKKVAKKPPQKQKKKVKRGILPDGVSFIFHTPLGSSENPEDFAPLISKFTVICRCKKPKPVIGKNAYDNCQYLKLFFPFETLAGVTWGDLGFRLEKKV